MASRPAISPRHPVFCPGKSCDARIWWKNITTPAGLRNLPLQADPDDAGTVAARPYATLPGRFLAHGETLADGESRWVNHFDQCPDAEAFRGRGHHRPRPRPAADPQPALFPATKEGPATP